MASRGSPPRVRGVCAVLFADLASGPERLAIIDRIREDPGIEELAELELLEIEADPARARADSARVDVSSAAAILQGYTVDADSALRWHAFERLAALSDPTVAARRRRAQLAAGMAPIASALGDDATALRWTELLARDWDVLSSEMEGGLVLDIQRDHLDRLVLQRAYIELRAGRMPERPQRQPGTSEARRRLDDQWRELEGVLDFAARGQLDKLREPGELVTFARSRRVSRTQFEGLEVAARGSGDELARWLAGPGRSDRGVALLGARRLTTGKQALLAWLRVPTSPLTIPPYFAAIDAAGSQKIAEALSDSTVAAEYRLRAERLRRGLLRRDTAVVRALLPGDWVGPTASAGTN